VKLAWIMPLLVACDRPRARLEPVACATWETGARALLEERCSTCHSGERPAGRWDVTTYHGAIGLGSDEVPNAIAGDARSLLLVRIDPDVADDVHRPHADARGPLVRWVVECDLALRPSLIHAPGIQDPASPEFHGGLLRSFSYDLGACARCHGDDLRGGGARSSCTTCHPGGPDSCETCHRGGVDAEHRAHADRGCETCHVVPSALGAAGHVLDAGGAIDPPPAEVRFSGLAISPRAPGEWDGLRCTNVYCHGRASPTWAVGLGQGDCGTCHTNPPESHASDRCLHCHQREPDGEGPLHLNGAVEIGPSDGGCRGCHGEAAAPAPPPSLSGRTDRSAIEVGAHGIHAAPVLALRGPMACEECHRVPADLDSPGHIDSELPAEVFPRAIAGTSIAFARGTDPVWERSTATCVVYCHGDAEPIWTLADHQVFCGTCHGIPPIDLVHDPAWEVSECGRCHGASVDPFGNPILIDERSEHIDGDVDL
jgi:hypothetical protein